MRLPSVPGPRDVLALPERVFRLLDDAGRLIGDVDALLARIERTRSSADTLIAGIEQPVARLVVLLDSIEPPLTKLQPTLERLAATTAEHEIEALVRLVDHLPQLVEQLERDILPILGTLGSVAPDLHDLLDVSRELNEMLAKMPGLGRIRRRVDERQAEEEA